MRPMFPFACTCTCTFKRCLGIYFCGNYSRFVEDALDLGDIYILGILSTDGIINSILEGIFIILPAYFYIIILVSMLQILKTDPAQSLEREVFVYFFNDPDKLRRAIDKLNAQVQAQMVK